MGIPATFDTLGNDGLRERFNRALGEVIANIEDPNTEAKKERRLIVEISIKPSKERNFAAMTYGVKTKVCPTAPVELTALTETNKATGETVLTIPEIGTDPAQHELPINVTKFAAAGGAKE